MISTNKLRVVSYNVLSSKLARPSHFTTTNPDYLEASYRLPLILSKIENEMGRAFGAGTTELDSTNPSTSPPTIFCLQEIDYTFTSALHTFFANKGYAFVTGLYGKKFNGYMGVGIAYPLQEFETIKVDICRLSDERVEGWPTPPEDELKEGVIKKVTNGVVKRVKKLASYTGLLQNYIGKYLGMDFPLLLGLPAESKIDPWEISENRFNILLTVALRFRGDTTGSIDDMSSNVFSISNYHMPCAFYCPPVMNIHIDMAAQRAKQLAAEIWSNVHGSNGSDAIKPEGRIPHILAGDFNILPDSSHYTLITTGRLDELDPTCPPLKHGVKWKPTCIAMDSAYAVHCGTEPSFTNYAHLKEGEDPFIGTLDYIFLSRKEGSSDNDWVVCDTVKLPEREASGGPFPNHCEPSDHLLIAADLQLR
jgi:mRNA deadenylase 3'-5' endonuclease subunit Ccr4